ncbi:MAG: response regulator [Gammaproteobacteria bacterium]|nr:response regulator [Gammaproteobacteria bacterium]
MNEDQSNHRKASAGWRFQHLLTLLFGVGVLCVAALGGLINSWSASEEVRSKLVNQGFQITTSFARQSTLALLYGQGDNAREAASTTLGFPGVVNVAIYDRSREVLLNRGEVRGAVPEISGRTITTPKAWMEETPSAWHFLAPVFSDFPEEERYRSPFVLEADEPEFLGWVRVVVDKSGLYALRRDMFVKNFVGMFAAATVLLLLMLWLTSRLTRPLNELSGLMRRAENGDSGVRAHPNGPWEIQNMSRAFNTMMSTLERRAERLDKQNAMLIQDMEAQKKAEAERAQLQQQLQQARKMEALGQLTGGIAHDFNNMLASILGYTELAITNMDSKPKDKIRSYLSEVKTAGERARDLIGQMLTFSRQGASSPQPLDIAPMVKEVVKMLGSMLPTSIELTTDFEQGLPCVRMDPVQLHQVVMNLCINARDAMDDSGRLSIAIRSRRGLAYECTSCHVRGEGDFVELSVSDTGEGMDQEFLSRIFDPFFTTKDVGKGSGMGLSVVHGIVHEHGGHVVVDSRRGFGATFHVLLPSATEQVGECKPRPYVSNSRNQSAGGHIMVVDDEVSVGSYLRELLEDAGYDVTLHTDPETALEDFGRRAQEIDLVVTDQTMPRLTGEELASRMLSVRPDLPIVLCTGYSTRIDCESAKNLRIRSFMRKPIDSAALLETIERLVAHGATTWHRGG